MDKEPTQVGTNVPDTLYMKLKYLLEELDWVSDAEVRLREEGDIYTGEVYVVPKFEKDLVENIRLATNRVLDFDWRISDIVITPVSALQQNKN